MHPLHIPSQTAVHVKYSSPLGPDPTPDHRPPGIPRRRQITRYNHCAEQETFLSTLPEQMPLPSDAALAEPRRAFEG